LSGFLERLEDTHREAAKAGDVFGAEAGTDAAAILIVVPVADVVRAVDAPVPAMLQPSSKGITVPISLVRFCSSLPATGKVPTFWGGDSSSSHVPPRS
jgi:hypothetical protein